MVDKQANDNFVKKNNLAFSFPKIIYTRCVATLIYISLLTPKVVQLKK